MREKRVAHKSRGSHSRKRSSRKRLAPKDWRPADVLQPGAVGLGPGTAGQSGDIEGLPVEALGDSESVAELVEEGQDFEAERVSGVENVPDPDEVSVLEESAKEE